MYGSKLLKSLNSSNKGIKTKQNHTKRSRTLPMPFPSPPSLHLADGCLCAIIVLGHSRGATGNGQSGANHFCFLVLKKKCNALFGHTNLIYCRLALRNKFFADVQRW
jgi:hypothetical protein